MDSTHKFYNRISYDIAVTLVADKVGIIINARDLRSSRKFQKMIDHVGMYNQMDKEFPNTGKLFEFLGNEDNFVVDPMNGRVVLQTKKDKKI